MCGGFGEWWRLQGALSMHRLLLLRASYFPQLADPPLANLAHQQHLCDPNRTHECQQRQPAVKKEDALVRTARNEDLSHSVHHHLTMWIKTKAKQQHFSSLPLKVQNARLRRRQKERLLESI
jgi:hypothetical protein